MMAQVLVDVILDRLPNTSITAIKAVSGVVYLKNNIMSTSSERLSRYI